VHLHDVRHQDHDTFSAIKETIAATPHHLNIELYLKAALESASCGNIESLGKSSIISLVLTGVTSVSAAVAVRSSAEVAGTLSVSDTVAQCTSSLNVEVQVVSSGPKHAPAV